MNTRQVRFFALACALSIANSSGAQESHVGASALVPFGSERAFTQYVERVTDSEQRRRCTSTAVATVTAAMIPDTAGGDSSAVVEGRVMSDAGAPVIGASVFIEGLNAGTVTGADGHFRFLVPPSRLHTDQIRRLETRLIGYFPRTYETVLHPRMRLTAEFTLCSNPVQLGEVVVTGMGTEGSADKISASGDPGSITYMQVAGVDEGDIVKAHGDFLVILRRGRLFTVRIGGAQLQPVSAMNAYGPGIDPRGTWYDELMIWRDRVAVIGYSYQRGGTEIGVFDLDRSGALTYRATYQLKSNDYYSSRNYASRLVGSKLVFYSPTLHSWSEPDALADLPSMRRWKGDTSSRGFTPIATMQHVYHAARDWDGAYAVALHSITSCDLATDDLRCESSVVVAPPGNVFYVSESAVYIWTGGYGRAAGNLAGKLAGDTADRATAMLFRLPLDGSAPSALGVAGSPVDQFAFDESRDGHLNVLLRGMARGDWMWSAEHSDGGVSLLRVPLTMLGDGSSAAPYWDYRALPAVAAGAFHERFVGDYVLYGVGNGWGPSRAPASTLHVVPWRGGDVTSLTLGHGIDRIEVMGRDAVVVGGSQRDLVFTGIRLEGTPSALQHFVLVGATQGELRSHGFFYRNDGTDTGIIGLPVRGAGSPGYAHLFSGSAAVIFLRNDGEGFEQLGELRATSDASPPDRCVASCVDWYGNARPIFIGSRAFALLGYELVEGRLDERGLMELRRVSFAPLITLGGRD